VENGGPVNLPPVEITTTSLVDEISFRLQAAILDGTYPPGTHLFQDELCERFGVSRTPVREALRKLQAKHLLVLVPNKGATVRVPKREELIDVYAVRAELEGYAAELAAGDATDELVAALDRSQQEVAEAVERFERGGVSDSDTISLDVQVSRANESFHDLIARHAHNERLRSLIGDLQDFFPKDYVWRAMSTADEVRALNLGEHEQIRDALVARDPQRARLEMAAHIRHACRIVVHYLDEHAFWG
jgi:DNA-binding GntR family transcriptional regulator